MTLYLKINFFHHQMNASFEHDSQSPIDAIIAGHQKFKEATAHIPTNEVISEILMAFTHKPRSPADIEKKQTAARLFAGLHFSLNPNDKNKDNVSIDISQVLTKLGIDPLDIAKELNIFLIEQNEATCELHNLPHEVQEALDEANKKFNSPVLVKFETRDDSFTIQTIDGATEVFKYDPNNNRYLSTIKETHSAPKVLH